MKTRLTALVFLVVAMVCPAMSQEISVGIVSPEYDEYVNAATAKSLVNKLQLILSKNSIADSGSDFVLIPSVTVEEDEMIETGMVNMFKITGTLNLSLTQLSTGKTFGSTAVEIKGHGKRDKAAAVKAAVGSLKVNNPELIAFLDKSKQNVVTYYRNNSSSIIAQANSAAAQGDYEKALAIMSSFPMGMPNEKAVNSAMASIYKQYINHDCKAIITQAKAALATKDYALCSALLADVDPSSSCYSEAISITNTIGREVRQAEANERADRRRRENLAADITKTRINAARDVAKAYYRRTYPTYNIIFR